MRMGRAGMRTAPAGGEQCRGIRVYSGVRTARCTWCQGVCLSTCATCIYVQVSPVAVPSVQRCAGEHRRLTRQQVGELSCEQVAGEQP